MRMIENNIAVLSGTIESIEHSHETHGEKYNKITVSCKRRSERIDHIPVIASERLTCNPGIKEGDGILINGTFRSVMTNEHMEAFVFADDVQKCELGEDLNSVHLDGYICKDVVHRYTPFDREISDVFMAVNRPYGRSDYIPVLCWGRNARFASGLDVGTRIVIDGRMQSRDYMKKLDDGKWIMRTVYEVSSQSISVVVKENTMEKERD